MSNTQERDQFNFAIINITESDTPKATIQRNKQWVEYGQKNDYFSHIIELYKNSSINKSLIDAIVRRIIGNGLSSEVGTATDLAKARQLFKPMEVFKFVLDYKLQGNAALKIITNKLGVPTKVKHWPIETLRAEKANDDAEIENYYYSGNWAEMRKQEYRPEPIEVWNPEAKKAGEFVYVLKEYTPDSFYYGTPDYLGATKWIECDIEIALYHLSNIKTGFSAATIIQLFNGEPTPQQRIELERRFEQKFTGSQGKKIIFQFNDSKEQAAEITQSPIPEADKQYEFLANEVRQNIMVGHRITSPMLLGIKQNTGLGNNADEIKQAENLLQKVVIRPYQQTIEHFLQTIATAAGLSVQLYFQPTTLIETAQQERQVLRKVEMSDEKLILDEHVDPILSYLNQEGEDEDELLNSGFKLFSDEDLNGDDELQVKGENLKKVEFLSAWGINADNLSKYDVKSKDNNGAWLVRYQYALARENAGQPDIIQTSRRFCKNMIDAAKNGNRVYKREVLENLNNPEFGSYNIFWYKGSYNCRHVWRRKIYFKSFDTNEVRPVGNVPYVVSRSNDTRATTKNNPPTR